MKKKTTKNTKVPIYIVGFDSINAYELGVIGGGQWFFKREDAMKEFKKHFVKDTHMVWFRVHKVAVKGGTLKERKDKINANVKKNIFDNGAERDWK